MIALPPKKKVLEDINEACLSDIIHTHPVPGMTIKHFSAFERKLLTLFDWSLSHSTIHGFAAELTEILELPNMHSIVMAVDAYTSTITLGTTCFCKG